MIRKLNGEITGTADRALNTSVSELRKRGEQILAGLSREKVGLAPSTAALGGGSAPDERFPSLSLVLSGDRSARNDLDQLRENDPPIIGTISEDRVHLNLATIQPQEIPLLSQALLRWQQAERDAP